MPRHPWRPLFPPPTWFMTSLALHTRTWMIWHEEEQHTLRRPSWPGLATFLDHWREPKVKHQDLRAMACECKGCLVDGCRGSASRSCGWPLANKKRAIMRCHWCTADEEKTADREPGIAWRKQPQHATEQLTTTPQTQIPTAPDTTTESRATGATAAAVPTGRTPKQPQPDPQLVAVRPERQLSQLPLEKASASAWPATEQPHELIETVTAQHRTDAGVVRTQADAEITHHTIEPPTEVSCDADTGTTKQK